MQTDNKEPKLFELPEQKECTIPDVSKRLRALEKRVFLWGAESEADKKHFKQRITDWCKEPEYTISLTKLCWEMTWERNDEGRTCKYLYFNERSQRIYLDNDFFEWVKLITGEIERALANVC